MRLTIGRPRFMRSYSGVMKPPTPAEAAADAIIARMDTDPPSGRRAAMITLIESLRSNDAWDLLDALYIFAAHDEQAAGLNWIADNFNAELVGVGGSFVVDEGFVTCGQTGWVETSYVPSTAGGQFAVGSAAFGFWNRANNAEIDTEHDAGTIDDLFKCTIRCRYINSGVVFMHGRPVGGVLFANDAAAGFYGASIGVSGTRYTYVHQSIDNLVDATSFSDASAASSRSSNSIRFGGSTRTGRQFAAGFIGGNMFASRIQAVGDAVREYLETLGKNTVYASTPPNASGYASEMITNGDFSSSTGWNLSQASIAGGQLTLNGAGVGFPTADREAAVTVLAGYVYRYEFTVVSITSGGLVKVTVGDYDSGNLGLSVGSYSGNIYTPTAGVVQQLVIEGLSNTVNCVIDNFSVKRLEHHVLGDEFVSNGSFSSGTGWSVGFSANISGGTLNFFAGTTETAITTAASTLTDGRYRISLTLTASSSPGAVYVSIGGTDTEVIPVSNRIGVHLADVTISPANQTIIIYIASGTLSVDDLSIKKIVV